MTPSAITRYRLAVVAAYAFAAGLAGPGGVTAPELITLVVLAAVALIYVTLADWIAGGVRLR